MAILHVSAGEIGLSWERTEQRLDP